MSGICSSHRLRVGVIRHFYTKDVAGNPEQVEALEAAVELVAEAGAEISEISLPALQDFSACGQIILAAEAYAVHEQWLKERPQDYGARARERLLAGAALRAVDYLQAVRWRLQLRDRVAEAFANIDIAIIASSMDPACRIDDDEALATNYWRQARMPFNVTGQPALVISGRFYSRQWLTALLATRRPPVCRGNALPHRAILRECDGLDETSSFGVGRLIVGESPETAHERGPINRQAEPRGGPSVFFGAQDFLSAPSLTNTSCAARNASSPAGMPQ